MAALLGLGNHNHFDAQLPMALESVIDESVDEHFAFDLVQDGPGPIRISLRRTFRELVLETRQGASAAELSAKLHNTLAEALLEMAVRAGKKTGLDAVALSGGVFCNRYLVNRLVRRLNQSGFTVLCNRDVPANDGGIALGQAAIATNMANCISSSVSKGTLP